MSILLFYQFSKIKKTPLEDTGAIREVAAGGSGIENLPYAAKPLLRQNGFQVHCLGTRSSQFLSRIKREQ
jgi:hypothetical protein